jgi:hypothetical protein
MHHGFFDALEADQHATQIAPCVAVAGAGAVVLVRVLVLIGFGIVHHVTDGRLEV